MTIEMDKELIHELQRIGLNRYESKAYLALLNSGPLTASELSEKTDIPRPRTYDILKNLEEKGMSATQPGRPAKHSSHPINEALTNLKKMKKQEHKEELSAIDKVKEKLQNKVNDLQTEEKDQAEDFMWFLKDKDKIHSKIKSLLQNAQEQVVIATDSEEAREHLEKYESELREARKKGANVKILTDEAKNLENFKNIAEVEEKDHGHRFMTIDNDSVLFLTPKNEENEVGAWVKSPFLTQSLNKKISPIPKALD